MGALRLADAIAVLRSTRSEWHPDWQLFVRLAGEATEVPLTDVLAQQGLEPVLDWSVRHERGIRGVRSYILTDQNERPLWDQPAFPPDDNPGVIVVPWFRDGSEMWLGLQIEYRPLLRDADGHQGAEITAFPRGYAAPGESPKIAAERELLEETSLRALEVTVLGNVVADTAWFPDGPVVCAARITPQTTPIEFDGSHEGVKNVRFEPLKSLVGTLPTRCGFTLAALAYFLEFALQSGWTLKGN